MEDLEISDQKRTEEKFDKYASQKSVSQNLLNTSAIQTQIGNLVFLFSNGKNFSEFEIATISIIFVSIFLQINIFFLVVWLFHVKPTYKFKLLSAEIMNAIVTALSGISLILNMTITVLILEIRS